MGAVEGLTGVIGNTAARFSFSDAGAASEWLAPRLEQELRAQLESEAMASAAFNASERLRERAENLLQKIAKEIKRNGST